MDIQLKQVLPFGQVNVDAADINVSTDASVATTFTFPSPVYLQDNARILLLLLSKSQMTYNLYCKNGTKNFR